MTERKTGFAQDSWNNVSQLRSGTSESTRSFNQVAQLKPSGGAAPKPERPSEATSNKPIRSE